MERVGNTLAEIATLSPILYPLFPTQHGCTTRPAFH